MPAAEVHIQILVHRGTGLLMATSDEVPGFVAHANTEDEMEQKLGPALNSFMKATGHDVIYTEVEKDERIPGFGPPEFIARRAFAETA